VNDPLLGRRCSKFQPFTTSEYFWSITVAHLSSGLRSLLVKSNLETLPPDDILYIGPDTFVHHPQSVEFACELNSLALYFTTLKEQLGGRPKHHGSYPLFTALCFHGKPSSQQSLRAALLETHACLIPGLPSVPVSLWPLARKLAPYLPLGSGPVLEICSWILDSAWPLA
jgi:hypothetical protein